MAIEIVLEALLAISEIFQKMKASRAFGDVISQWGTIWKLLCAAVIVAMQTYAASQTGLGNELSRGMQHSQTSKFSS